MYRNINREKRNIVYVERRNLEEQCTEKFIGKENENVCGLSMKKSTTHKMGRKKKIGFLYGEVTILTILTKKNIFTIYKLYKSYVFNTKNLIFSLQIFFGVNFVWPVFFNHSTLDCVMIDLFVYVLSSHSTFVVGIILTIYRN